MRKIKKAKWLVVLMVVAMLFAMVPAVGGADTVNNNNNDASPAYAFIPNSGEASVSKVLLNPEDPDDDPYEVARYSTLLGDRDDYSDDEIELNRPNRIAIDSGGNAWVLNTMSGKVDGWDTAQGSVVRISGSPVDGELEESDNDYPNTSIEGGYEGMVEDDVRVSYFEVGAGGEAPRTISIVEEEGEIYLWIGFYVGRYFQKYHYNADSGTLEAVSETKIEVEGYTPYYTVLDDGYMWVSSRNSGFPTSGVNGVLLVDLENLSYQSVVYDPPTTGTNIPYSIVIDSDGKAWVSDSSGGLSERDRHFAVYTRDNGDVTETQYIFVGNYSVMCGFTEFENDIWATDYYGKVIQGTLNTDWDFDTVLDLGPNTAGNAWITGITPDPFGYLWVISHDDNSLFRFHPDDPSNFVRVPVGVGPYAYADFTTVVETGCLSVEKLWEVDDDVIGFDEDTMIPDEIDILIKGPSFDADYTDGKPFTLKSEDDWSLDVCDLEPGEYFVYEDAEDEDWYDLWDIDIDPVSVTVAAGDEPEVNLVTITNTYQPGCLEITKEWIYGEGDDETGDYIPVDMPDEISVLIEGPSYPDGKVVTLEPEDWSWESCNVLIPGRYFLTELDFEGSEFWSSVYIVDGSAVAGWVDVEPDETAEVTIRNYYLFKDDTIWAYSAYAYDELKLTGDEEEGVVYHNNKVDGNPSNAWGWTNFIDEDTVTTSVYGDVRTYEFYLFAGAGQNDTERGEKVGTLTVEVEPEVCEETGEELDTFCATVTYDVDAPYVLSEYHLWVGDTPLPEVQRGRGTVPTAAPGQFPYGDGDKVCGLEIGEDKGFFVAAHGVIRMPYEPVPEKCTWTGVWDTTLTGESIENGELEVTFIQDNNTVTGSAPALVFNKWFEGTVEDDTLSGVWGQGSWEVGTFEITMSADCQKFEGIRTEYVNPEIEYDWTGVRQ